MESEPRLHILFSRAEIEATVSRLASAGSYRADEVYALGVREQDLHFFDRQTETRTQPKVLAWQ